MIPLKERYKVSVSFSLWRGLLSKRGIWREKNQVAEAKKKMEITLLQRTYAMVLILDHKHRSAK